MNRISLFVILLIQVLYLSIICPGPLQAEPEKMSIKDAVRSFAEKHGSMRITVADFSGTEATGTRYDSYIADSLLYELGKYKKYRLIERKRLKSVLSELALSQTSVISADQALRIGEILPVDVLVTGSYTRLGSRIMVNGRFINVVTGEIIHTISFSMDAGPGIAVAPAEDQCKKKQQEVKTLLNDLTTEEKINSVVGRATLIPFDMECGRVHFRVMAVFRRYKIYPAAYTKFLISALKSIENPSLDYRAMDILRYFSSDGTVDNGEWEAGLYAVRRSRTSTLHSYLRYLFNNDGEPASLVRKRVRTVMTMGRKKEIGRPVTFTSEQIFFKVMHGLGTTYRKNLANPLYVFEKYSPMVSDTEEANRKALGMLETIYFGKISRNQQIKTIELTIRFLKKREKEVKTADRLWYFTKKIERKASSKDTKTPFTTDLKRLNKGLADWFCFAEASAAYPSGKKERAAYLEIHGIKCRP